MGFVFVKQKTAYEMRISDWSSDVCSSDLSLGFTEAIFHVLVSEVQLAAAGLTIGVIGGQIDALRHLHGCTGAELPCEANRSEERRVGKECVSTCRSRWSPNP